MPVRGLALTTILFFFLCAIGFCETAHELYFNGKSEHALKLYRTLHQQHPSDTILLKNMYCVAHDLHDTAVQESTLRQLHAHEPESVWVARQQGWYAAAQGDFKKARQYCGSLLAQKPDDAQALLCLGLIGLSDKTFEEARTYLSRMETHHPEWASPFMIKGRILYEQEQYAAAIKAYTQAIKNDYAMPEARFFLVDAYVNSGQVDQAWQQITKLLNIDPHNRLAQATAHDDVFAMYRAQPETVREGRHLSSHSLVTPVKNPDVIPYLDVGLAVDGKGESVPMSSVMINGRATASTWPDTHHTIHASDKAIEWKIEVSADASHIMIYTTDNKLLGQTDSSVCLIPATSKDTLIIRNVPYATGYAWAGTDDREYRGTIIIKRDGKNLVLVNRINIEAYLQSVLPSEMIASWPMEALKAQAVIARGFAYFKKKHPVHRKRGYEICSGQHCQVYAGVTNEMKQTDTAVRQTRGQVVYYRGRIANTLYSSNCGGHTQSSKDLKNWSDVAYLTGVSDAQSNNDTPETPYELFKWIQNQNPPCLCKPSRYTYRAESRWVRAVPAYLVNERMNRRYRTGTISDVIVLRRAPSGHIRALKVIGTKRTVIIEKENKIRGAFAPGGLRSTYYIVHIIRRDGKPVFFVFFGGGWGHAVGLCQSGAAGMAVQGKQYQDILYHYYKHTKIKQLDW
ncbi:MAG: SpoIID/LytB domain-containing protein [Elusimicrobia bacterium]|nr:SpoIID/LytB domain-containing protein [Elusimicrobiota bacterium]MBD3412302.1 SpoIID/LytB domain-containing protein [Elusimicrobiota bacterium]